MKDPFPETSVQKDQIISAIKEIAAELGRPPSRSEFLKRSGISEYYVTKFFIGWRQAVAESGLEPNLSNVKIDDEVLLQDWGCVVREIRHIPTQVLYRKSGKFSLSTYEKRFGPWSVIPQKFREFAQERPEWVDVLALLPVVSNSPDLRIRLRQSETGEAPATHKAVSDHQHNRLGGVPTFGDPIDFRGLRHEPVNEQGVVFLFGMVARELGYMVEAVQTGYPDCEAKRQIGPGKWQRVRVEFEFESRNFKAHGHPVDGCDVIVCWRHNWLDCPENLEVLELQSVIKTLAASED